MDVLLFCFLGKEVWRNCDAEDDAKCGKKSGSTSRYLSRLKVDENVSQRVSPVTVPIARIVEELSHDDGHDEDDVQCSAGTKLGRRNWKLKYIHVRKIHIISH